MFETLLPKGTKPLLKETATIINKWDFYLGAGTGLTLQLGHRKSKDLDLFRENKFDSQLLWVELKDKIPNHKEIMIEKNTLVCELQKIKLSFFYSEVPLIFKCHSLFQIRIANWKDIVADKFKTIAQRGCKRDFYDLYYVFFTNKLSIEEASKIFREKFKTPKINFYHVLKSLTYFEEAEHEPEVELLREKIPWSKVKSFFIENIHEFEKWLIM